MGVGVGIVSISDDVFVVIFCVGLFLSLCVSLILLL